MFPWLKQVRPLKKIWKQKDKIEKQFKELSKTTGIHGGNIQGSRQIKAMSKTRGIKHISESNSFRQSALQPLFPGLKDWFTSLG